MSVAQIAGLSAIEIVGDFGLKEFANKGGLIPLLFGLGGYVGVVIMLIVSLQGSTILMVNGAGDGISTIIESLAAYIFLGERFESVYQYFGLLLIIIGLFLLKIPLTKAEPFVWPKMWK
jgi:multidrug transporter EmrE-like cation transporter